jgi:hypothetical protein
MIASLRQRRTGKFSRVGFGSSTLPKKLWLRIRGLLFSAAGLSKIRLPLGGDGHRKRLFPRLPVIISSITDVRPFAVIFLARKSDDIFKERNSGEKFRHKSAPLAADMEGLKHALQPSGKQLRTASWGA